MIRADLRIRPDGRGFTLIEVLVTISIIGILAGIAALSVTTFRSKSSNQACVTDVQAAMVALDTYKTSFGGYAADTSALYSAGVVRTLDSSDSYDVTYAGSGTPPSSYVITVKVGTGPVRTLGPTADRAAIKIACS